MIEVEVLAEGDIVGRAVVPSGASTGQFEAVEPVIRKDVIQWTWRAACRRTCQHDPGRLCDW